MQKGCIYRPIKGLRLETTKNSLVESMDSLSTFPGGRHPSFACGKFIATSGSQRPLPFRLALSLCVMGNLTFRLQFEVASTAIASSKHRSASLAFSNRLSDDVLRVEMEQSDLPYGDSPVCVRRCLSMSCLRLKEATQMPHSYIWNWASCTVNGKFPFSDN